MIGPSPTQPLYQTRAPCQVAHIRSRLRFVLLVFGWSVAGCIRGRCGEQTHHRAPGRMSAAFLDSQRIEPAGALHLHPAACEQRLTRRLAILALVLVPDLHRLPIRIHHLTLWAPSPPALVAPTSRSPVLPHPRPTARLPHAVPPAPRPDRLHPTPDAARCARRQLLLLFGPPCTAADADQDCATDGSGSDAPARVGRPSAAIRHTPLHHHTSNRSNLISERPRP